jgi:hypothetical protein
MTALHAAGIQFWADDKRSPANIVRGDATQSSACGIPALKEWLEKSETWCQQAQELEQQWGNPEVRASLKDGSEWIDEVHYSVCSEFLDAQPLNTEQQQMKPHLRKAWVTFNNLRVRMDSVPTAGVIPPVINAGLPAPTGLLNPKALKDAIATAEYGEYRGNCLYCHRQNWCGVNHKSIYCPFRLVTMHPGKLKNFMGAQQSAWPASKATAIWHKAGNFIKPGDLYFVYRYLRDNKHCFICQWPCEWIMPFQKMVSRSAQQLWREAYKDTSNVGHCTLDCPQMAPWDILVGRMAELSKNRDGGDMGLADEGNELADALKTGLIKPEANAANPVTAFLGPGMVMPHLLGKTADNNTWRVLAPGRERIFPWNVPASGHD